ncbi:MAG: hypothetical protein J1F35_08180 [Erysipelotrichales bacterium]|nr:hypothetical protein [Erysipelotrichales bacterium]
MKSLKEFILESNSSLIDKFQDLKRFSKRLSKSDIKLSTKTLKWIKSQIGSTNPYILDTSGLLDYGGQISDFIKSFYRNYGYASDEKQLETTKDKDFKLDSFNAGKISNNAKLITLVKDDKHWILFV